jgi:hypothetical protein
VIYCLVSGVSFLLYELVAICILEAPDAVMWSLVVFAL